LSTSLKGPLGMLIAGLLALSLASLVGAALPPAAQAQDTSGASTQEAQQQNNNTDTTSETAAPPALVVEPGDSLWAIAQERLGAGATAEQVAEEVERIHALNRGRIAEDPNLLFPGQELRLAATATQAPATPRPAAEPAATEPVAEPSGAEPSAAEPTIGDLQTVPGSAATAPAVVPEEQPATGNTPAPPSADPKDERAADPSQADSVRTDSSSTDSSSWTNSEPAYPGPDRMAYARYGVLELTFLAVLFLFSLAVGVFGAAKLIRTRRKLSKQIKPSAPEVRLDDPHHHGAQDVLLHQERETDRHGAEAPEPAIAGSRTSNARVSASGSGDQT
jgi:LysM domain